MRLEERCREREESPKREGKRRREREGRETTQGIKRCAIWSEEVWTLGRIDHREGGYNKGNRPARGRKTTPWWENPRAQEEEDDRGRGIQREEESRSDEGRIRTSAFSTPRLQPWLDPLILALTPPRSSHRDRTTETVGSQER